MAQVEEEQLEPPFSLKGIEGLPLKETKMVMQRAIALLTEKERTVLTLCYFEGLKYEEVAARLGETVESVRYLFYQTTKKVMNGAIELADEMKLPTLPDS
jgi:RNA polymerase sigma factor (sigma-70 family)